MSVAALQYVSELLTDTIGIPYEQWNSVKYADCPEYAAACEKAGREL